jgi:alpha-glucosidase (family GH31 glycosyl hydrolase)
VEIFLKNKMKNSIELSLILILFFLVQTGSSQSIQDVLTIKNDSDVYWYTGVVEHGHFMPIKRSYEADLYGNNYGNQIQPLLLSNKGDVIWCNSPIKINITQNNVIVKSHNNEIVKYNKAGNTLKEAYRFVVENYFSCSGKLPDNDLFLKPQYNTWIELLYNQNQKDILNYADCIIKNNFPTGVLMIDDNWQEDYGKWNFHPGRFSDPKKMIEELHDKGFKVMLWICPFISPDNDVYRELAKNGWLLKDGNSLPKMIRWWNGVSAVLDFTNPDALTWFKSQLNVLIFEYKVDGFKFDAGDPRFYLDVKGYKNISPNEHTELYAKIGLDYPLNEYRANWKMACQPLANRIRDKDHSWEDLKTLVPNMIVAGLMGYPYSCPDMIGGGNSDSFLNGAKIDQELIIRSAQCHALMPMMQFSVAPWRILDSIQLKIVKKAVRIREDHIGYIINVVNESKKDCSPVLRSMEYSFPNSGYEKNNNQFMIGEDLLVAPILDKRCKVHKILIPKGKWKGYNGKIYQGPESCELSVELSDLPYFERIK